MTDGAMMAAQPVTAILERATEALSRVGEHVLVERLHRLLDDRGSNDLPALSELLPLARACVLALPHLAADDDAVAATPATHALGMALQERGVALPDLVAEGLWLHHHALREVARELRAGDRTLVSALLRISHAILSLEQAVLLAYQENADATLLRLAMSDTLTHLANRRYFQERFAEEVQRARRMRHPLALVVVDLDGLKTTNDTHGHAAGDRLLRTFADLLQGHLRAIDIAARLGGDEFVVLLPETGEAGAAVLIQRLEQRALDRAVEGQPLRFSAGIAVFPDHGETDEALFEYADTALYRAKWAKDGVTWPGPRPVGRHRDAPQPPQDDGENVRYVEEKDRSGRNDHGNRGFGEPDPA